MRDKRLKLVQNFALNATVFGSVWGEFPQLPVIVENFKGTLGISLAMDAMAIDTMAKGTMNSLRGILVWLMEL